MTLANVTQHETDTDLQIKPERNIRDRLKSATNLGVSVAGVAAFSYALYKTGQGFVNFLGSIPTDLGNGDYYYPNTHETIHLDPGESFPQESLSAITALKYGGSLAVTGLAIAYFDSDISRIETDK